MENPNAGVQINSDNDYVSVLIRLVVLLYADDTVILASNENDLQYTLDKFFDYCQTWKLRVNINKTKVLIFGARRTNSYSFHLGDNVIEITDKYKYLGIYFSQSRFFKREKAYCRTSEEGHASVILSYKQFKLTSWSSIEVVWSHSIANFNVCLRNF